MADDIDIEEHDILDNPRVQEILPQISSIKTEPLDYQEEYNENYHGDQSEYEAGFIDNLLREDEAYEPEYELELELEPTPYELSDMEDTVEETPPIIQQAFNRIILGSKPCPKRRKIKHLTILLEDWSERLNTSACYCKDCKTLFATRNALDAHNMIAHSFLVALDPPKEDLPLDNHKYCNHCQKYFQDDNMLIQHLYDLITAKQAKKDVKNVIVPTKTPVKSIVVTKQVQSDVKSVVDNVQPVDSSVELVMCPICMCLFKNHKRCIDHCRTRHHNTEIKPKLSTFEQKCKLCDRMLIRFKSYNSHIQTQHNQLYLKKVDGKVWDVLPVAPKPVLVKKTNYKCVTCHISFSNINAAKTHQLVKHGKHSKIVMTKKSARAVAKPTKRRCLDSGLVPKNVLFKCDKCPVHALTCITAIAHRVNKLGKHKKDHWKCNLCNRTFREIDKKLHLLQHKNAKEFKVYVFHENIYSRVLCRCPKCKIYFEERLFIRHTKHGCGITSNVACCDICELNVNNMPTHSLKHSTRGLIKSDFILIDDFMSLSDRCADNAIAVKRKLTDDCLKGATLAVKKKILFNSNGDNSTAIKRKLTGFNTQQSKRFKVETKECPKEGKVSDKKKILLYYCFSCVTFITQPGGMISQMTKRQKFHTLRKCKANQKKHLCKICGLPFNSGQVMNVHVSKVHAQSNVGVKDFSFANITDLKPCAPPMPVFPMCPKCGVSYLTISRRHVCFVNSSIKCKICKKTFEKKAYKLHILHHKYIGSLASEAEVDPIKKYLTKNTPKVEEKSLESTLKRKYRMMKPIWNILYSCKMCDVTTDYYDYVVEHCQKHYNKLESYDVTIEQCELCSLSFESDCFNRHKMLHTNRTIDRNAFKILQYDWFSLLTIGWMKLFDTLPKEQTSLILNRSIYVTLAVKMTLIVDGPPEYTIYECQSCAKIITADTVIFHAKNGAKCTKNGTKFKCSMCNFCFATRYARDVHVSIHKKQSVPANSFRVVAFNSPHEREFNAKLLAEHTEINKIKTIDSFLIQENQLSPYKTVFSTPTGNKYRYFQCQRCMCCVAKYSCMLNHVCNEEVRKIICPVCQYHFRCAGANTHIAKHMRNKDFTRDNIMIVPFNDEVRHRSRWKECKYCRLKFAKDTLARHIASEHRPNEPKPPEVKEFVEKNAPDTPAIPSITLFRCLHCKCLFLDKLVLTNHQNDCNPYKFEGEKCNKCGLVFHKNSLDEHLENCTPSQVKKHEVIGAYYSDRVYKCEECDLCFMTRTEVKLHLDKNHWKGHTKDCGRCGWKFQYFSLPKHIHYHHKSGKKLKDLTIVNIGDQIVQDKESSQNTSQKLDADQTSVSNIDVEDQEISNDVSFVSEQSETSVHQSKAKPNSTEYSQYRYMSKFTDGNKKVLFKCRQCDFYYINIASWISHCLLNHKIVRAACPCHICHLKFPPVTLAKHMRLHHIINKDSLDPDVEIIIPEEYSTSEKRSDDRTIEETLAETATTSATDMRDLNVTATENDVSDISQSSVEATTLEPKSDKIVSTPKEHSHKIYKCGQCNVYFMAQSTCYIHMLHHAPIDPKEYIECKLCNLPFKIMSLNIHIRKHHKGEFKLDEVLVEEYSNDGGKTPKIDIYYVADKLQSRLVSTTTVEPVTQSIQAVDSTEDVTDLHINKKSIDKQADSSEAGDANENSTALTDCVDRTQSTSKDLTNKPTCTDKNFSNEVEMDKIKLHECSFCGEKFKSHTSKEFHESLDHLDGVKDCQFCKQSFNMSILNEIHLNIKNDSFKCCLCNGRFKVREMMQHSDSHKGHIIID